MCALLPCSSGLLTGPVIGHDSREMYFFHYVGFLELRAVVGLDVIDAAHVSQYIASLVQAQDGLLVLAFPNRTYHSTVFVTICATIVALNFRPFKEALLNIMT
eukprot:6456575-Amphidinium_carterae.1